MQKETFKCALRASILEFLRKQKKEFTFEQLCNHFVDYRDEPRVTMSDVLDCLADLKEKGLIESIDIPTKYRAKI